MTPKTTLRTLRTISSFALLGAVVAGTLFGWGDQPADLARTWGAVGGAVIGTGLTAVKLFHIF